MQATFAARADVTVTIVKTGNGTVAPASTFTVKYGGDATVVANAAAGHRIQSVFVGGVPRPDAAGKSAYQVALTDMTSSTSVSVAFESIPNVTVTATAGDGGTATPGTQSVAHGGNATVSVTADAGHVISTVTVNGVAKPAAVGSSVYTVSLFDLTANAVIVASFVEIAQPPENLVPFGDGSIWIIHDEENPLAFGVIDFSSASGATVALIATMSADPGATTETIYLLVKTSLDDDLTYMIEGEIDADGVVVFDVPQDRGQLFIVGISNAPGTPLP